MEKNAVEMEEDSEEDYLDETRYDRMVKHWDGGNPLPYVPRTPKNPPKWRGDAKRYFDSHGPNPAYGIAQRARHITYCFKIRKTYIQYDSDYDDDDELEHHEEDESEEDERDQSVIWRIGLLDELEAYDAESIDVASVLHSNDLLFPFLGDLFDNKQACIRAKAAELITSMVKNHPTSQQLVIEADGVQVLLHNFITDPDTTSRTKTLGAISSLIRNNKSGITIFLREGGYEALKNALNSGTLLAGSSIHNELVNLIGYLRRENNLVMIQKYKKQEKVETVTSCGKKMMTNQSKTIQKEEEETIQASKDISEHLQEHCNI